MAFCQFPHISKKSIFNKQEIIGLVGNYDFINLPDEILIKVSNGLVTIDEKGVFRSRFSKFREVKDQGKRYRFYLKNNPTGTTIKNLQQKDINYQFNDVKIKVVDKNVLDFI